MRLIDADELCLQIKTAIQLLKAHTSLYEGPPKVYAQFAINSTNGFLELVERQPTMTGRKNDR